MKKYPDALTYDDIVNITGYNQKRIPDWISSEKLKWAKLNDKVNIISKQWLLGFTLTKESLYNYSYGNKIKRILCQAVIEYVTA